MKHILFHYETSELQNTKSCKLQVSSYKLLNISVLNLQPATGNLQLPVN